ncbi:MAG: radical SAM protein [Synergistaceae bacterium]|jgi:pyrroloquinoline quinone biosynthesis protein E|nr:radical SAM protein [Synergistaceae bacterium]
MTLRAEKRFLTLLSGEESCTVPAARYPIVEQMLNGVLGSEVEERWKVSLGRFAAWIRANPELVRNAMERSAWVDPPKNAYASPLLLNLELTTRCPLRCPQCYCDLERGKDLPLKRAVTVLKQAVAEGVGYVNLSGGETMVYPHLYPLLEVCSGLGLDSAVALSGWGVNRQSLRRLMDCGVGAIYVSLNGSTEEISRTTRDGFSLAIEALELLAEARFERTAINWVAHSANVEDFPNVAALCSKYGVRRLFVLGFKPDSARRMNGVPDARQTLALASDIRRLRKETPYLSIEVENCYSPLRAYLSRKFFGNLNVGISKGCGAGRDGASLDVDGNFTPCRHLEYPENFESLGDYWRDSPVLRTLREVEDRPEAPCDICGLSANCLCCMAVSAKLLGRLVKANEYCFLRKEPLDGTKMEKVHSF